MHEPHVARNGVARRCPKAGTQTFASLALALGCHVMVRRSRSSRQVGRRARARAVVAMVALWAAVLPAWCQCVVPAPSAVGHVDRTVRDARPEPGCHGHHDGDSTQVPNGESREDGSCCCVSGHLYATQVPTTEFAAPPLLVAVIRLQLPAARQALLPVAPPAVVPKLLNSPYVRENPPLLV